MLIHPVNTGEVSECFAPNEIRGTAAMLSTRCPHPFFRVMQALARHGQVEVTEFVYRVTVWW